MFTITGVAVILFGMAPFDENKGSSRVRPELFAGHKSSQANPAALSGHEEPEAFDGYIESVSPTRTGTPISRPRTTRTFTGLLLQGATYSRFSST